MGLNEFLEYVFGGDQEGYFAISLFKGGVPVAEQFIRVPDGLSKVTENRVRDLGTAGDVYFTPAIFRTKIRTTDECVGSWVAWADVDEPAPSVGTLSREAPSCPPAGLVVASGSPGREHRYWRSDAFLPPDPLLIANRSISLGVTGSDKSGVDPAQLLRLPGSFNHKWKPPKLVHILGSQGGTTDLSTLALPLPRVEDRDSLQNTLVSIERWNELSEYARKLSESRPLLGTRSDKLYELACRLLEEGLEVSEARTIVDQTAARWGKFDGRNDRDEQVDTILRRAVERTTPALTIVEAQPETDEDGINWDEAVGFQTLLTRSPRVEWIIPGILQKKGLMYLVGPTGVGKTTLAFNLGLNIALSRKDWLGFDIEQREAGEKIFVASHEMGNEELVEFLLPMSAEMLPEELDHLEEHFRTRATGQAVALDDERTQQAYASRLKAGGFTGFILDTLGASTKTSLQDEASTRKIADWLDKVRQKLGIWCIVIAHPRKVPAGIKNYRFSIDDAYGSRIFGDRANTVFIMQHTRAGLELNSVKTRFLSGTDTLYLRRRADHWFERTTGGVLQTPKPALTIESDITLADLEGEDNDFGSFDG